MGSRISYVGRFTFSLSWRVTLIGLFSLLAIYLFAKTHFYASATLLVALTILLTANLAHVIGKIERVAERDLRHLVASASPCDYTFSDDPGAALRERATTVLHAARARTQQHIEYLEMLLDTVTASLIVVEDSGRIRLANRAARALAGQPVGELGDISAIGESSARKILALRVGARDIISLANGERVFVSVARFSTPDSGACRLISLHRILGELAAVEQRAWHDMAQVLAHEIMNSLTPIASLSESLPELFEKSRSAQAVPPEEEILPALEAIKRRSHSLIDFVERYRAIATLPSPRFQLVLVRELLEGIIRLLSSELGKHHIDLRTSLTPPDLSFRGDRQLVEQALINLLRNAIEAEAGVSQPIIAITGDVKEGQVRIAVADNGNGIACEAREQIFVPFFTTKPGGSGIGLNLARQVALAHGGGLEVYANEPRGTVFTLTLPATA